jgi:hypothetical protein
MHKISKSLLLLCTITVLSTSLFGVTQYTTTMIDNYIGKLADNPHVFPTASSNGNFVLGQSYGWESPYAPKQNLYGFMITNPDSSLPRTKVVLISGNHNTEYSGNWALQGMLDFLISNDTRAAQLRNLAEFYVYPLVNPDGRYTKSGRGNRELSSLGYDDHNRVWDQTGISTIDAFTSAMILDTGGVAEYFFDFHNNAAYNCLLAIASMTTSDFCIALTKQEPTIRILADDGEQGMARLWVMSSSGLDATYAFTPEFTSTLSATKYRQMGQNYAMALYETLIPEPTTLILLALGAALIRRKH